MYRKSVKGRKQALVKYTKGGSFKSFFKKVGKAFKSAFNWLKKNKVLSTIGTAASALPGKYGKAASIGTPIVSSLGFGRKRVAYRKRGSGLVPAGGSYRRR